MTLSRKELIVEMAKAIFPTINPFRRSWDEMVANNIERGREPLSSWPIQKSLNAAESALSVLDDAGMAVVPVEPTEAMIEAGEELIPIARGTESRCGMPNPEQVYAAMIEAALTDQQI